MSSTPASNARIPASPLVATVNPYAVPARLGATTPEASGAVQPSTVGTLPAAFYEQPRAVRVDLGAHGRASQQVRMAASKVSEIERKLRDVDSDKKMHGKLFRGHFAWGSVGIAFSAASALLIPVAGIGGVLAAAGGVYAGIKMIAALCSGVQWYLAHREANQLKAQLEKAREQLADAEKLEIDLEPPPFMAAIPAASPYGVSLAPPTAEALNVARLAPYGGFPVFLPDAPAPSGAPASSPSTPTSRDEATAASAAAELEPATDPAGEHRPAAGASSAS